MEMTFEQLVCHLKEKASANTDAVGIFLEDLSSGRTVTVINNTAKKYNQAYIVIGPAGVEEMKQNGFVLEEVIQGAKTMSTPMKILSADLESKKINFLQENILSFNSYVNSYSLISQGIFLH